MLFDFLISLARITMWENGDKWKIMTFAAKLWAAADPVLIHEILTSRNRFPTNHEGLLFNDVNVIFA